MPTPKQDSYELASSDVVIGLSYAEARALLARAEVAADNPFEDDDADADRAIGLLRNVLAENAIAVTLDRDQWNTVAETLTEVADTVYDGLDEPSEYLRKIASTILNTPGVH